MLKVQVSFSKSKIKFELVKPSFFKYSKILSLKDWRSAWAVSTKMFSAFVVRVWHRSFKTFVKIWHFGSLLGKSTKCLSALEFSSLTTFFQNVCWNRTVRVAIFSFNNLENSGSIMCIEFWHFVCLDWNKLVIGRG